MANPIPYASICLAWNRRHFEPFQVSFTNHSFGAMSSQQASVDGNSHQWSCETLVDGLAHVKSRSQPPEDEEDLLKKLEDTTHVSLFLKAL